MSSERMSPVDTAWLHMDEPDNPADIIVYDYNITNPGYTTVWAVPEPASLALCGFGSLLLLMRRRR